MPVVLARHRGVTRRAPAVAACALLAALACPVAAQDAPPPGRYDGELCVAAGEAPASCGPAQVVVYRPGRGQQMLVTVADIVYRLALEGSRLELVLMHGAMQVDGFSAPYAWQAGTLAFSDPDKPVRYRVRLFRAGAG